MINIYIAENGTVKNKFIGTAIVSALVCPAEKYQETKAYINEVLNISGSNPFETTIRWSDVREQNENIYKNLFTVLNRIPELRYFGIEIPKFEAKKLNNSYIQLIKKIIHEYPLETQFRIFVIRKPFLPYNYTNNLMKKMGKSAEKVEIFQVDLPENRLTQCADLIGGAILYFKRDDQYFAKMNKRGKPVVVSHALSLKKKPNKFNMLEYKEEQND